MSLRRASSTMSRRETSFGSPASSSSPVIITEIVVFSSAPTRASARSASTMATSPPFMSDTPWPRTNSPSGCQAGVLEPASNTVSRWPSSSRRLPWLPVRVATRWPARPTSGGMSIHRVLKPSWSNCWRNRAPTCRTPAWFMVPLLMRAACSSSATACGVCALISATMRCSTGDSSSAADRLVTDIAAAASARPGFRCIGDLLLLSKEFHFTT